jgi:hypothetical protein
MKALIWINLTIDTDATSEGVRPPTVRQSLLRKTGGRVYGG